MTRSLCNLNNGSDLQGLRSEGRVVNVTDDESVWWLESIAAEVAQDVTLLSRLVCFVLFEYLHIYVTSNCHTSNV